jgi:hypothetical protein
MKSDHSNTRAQVRPRHAERCNDKCHGALTSASDRAVIAHSTFKTATSLVLGEKPAAIFSIDNRSNCPLFLKAILLKILEFMRGGTRFCAESTAVLMMCLVALEDAKR